MERKSAAELLHDVHKTDEQKHAEQTTDLSSKLSGITAPSKEAIREGKKDLTIVDIIRREHDEVDRLYSQYLAATAGEIKEAKGFLILRQLVMHSAKEEAVLYPAIRVKLENGNVSKRAQHQAAALADRSEEEHQKITEDLYELDKLVWPQNPSEFDRLELIDLGNRFMSQICTTRPHPSAPREGVAAQLAQAAMLPVDAIRDAFRFDDKTKAAAMTETK